MGRRQGYVPEWPTAALRRCTHIAAERGVFVARLLTLILAACSMSAAPCRAASEIPFTFRNGMIWLKVEVAGRSTPLNFLLDSGAGKTVVHLGTAQRLGLKLGARETVQGVQGRSAAYRIDSLAATVGSAPVPRDMLAFDLSSVSAESGSRIDGLLGADFFRDRVVQIDFAAQKVRLFDRSESCAIGGQILPLVRRHDALCVRVGVNGNAPQWMRLDTGCSGALEWVVAGAKSRRDSGTSVAATGTSREHIQTDVLLGSERIPAVKTGLHSQPLFAGENGLIGNGLLSQFRVTVDAAGGRLLLQRVVR